MPCSRLEVVRRPPVSVFCLATCLSNRACQRDFNHGLFIHSSTCKNICNPSARAFSDTMAPKPQWHALVTLEPPHGSDRVAISSTKPQSSTWRKPSVSEAVETATQPKAQSNCRRCHTLEHRTNSGACRMRLQELLEQSTKQALAATTAPAAITAATAPIEPVTTSAPALRYNDPRCIHQRYMVAKKD